MTRMPALSLAAVPGRRKATIELATEIERKGFSGIYGPSLGDSLALCEALAFATNEIHFGTSIMPIYFRQVADYAQTTSFIHEISDGRFKFGIGVSHAPALKQRGISGGKPLTDTRNFIEELRAVPRAGDPEKEDDCTGRGSWAGHGVCKRSKISYAGIVIGCFRCRETK